MFFKNILKRLGLFKENPKEPYSFLEDLLGFSPKNEEYYRLALLHKSFCVKDDQGHRLNNERLEYLGDAVLEAVVSDILYNLYPDKGEGYLTSLRSKIVQRETLNKLSVDMGLHKKMVVPAISHSHNVNIYGNAFEALIGAIYLDRGYSYVMSFMQNRVFKSYLDIDSLSNMEQNFKSRLIEWGHKYKATIEFNTSEEKRDKENNIIFQSNITVNGVVVSEGWGYSKRSSHQVAAQKALNRLTSDKELFDQLVHTKTN